MQGRDADKEIRKSIGNATQVFAIRRTSRKLDSRNLIRLPLDLMLRNRMCPDRWRLLDGKFEQNPILLQPSDNGTPSPESNATLAQQLRLRRSRID